MADVVDARNDADGGTGAAETVIVLRALSLWPAPVTRRVTVYVPGVSKRRDGFLSVEDVPARSHEREAIVPELRSVKLTVVPV